MSNRIGDISRRASLAAITMGAAGYALLGPRGYEDAGRGRIVLNYWEKWTQHEGDAMRTIVEEFNRSQNRIYVRYLVTAGIDQKTLISIAGGDPPDVVGLWNYNVPLYAETNAILPLDEFDSRHNVRLDRIALAFQSSCTHPDSTGRERLWAVVSTGGTLAMYYNRAMFRDAGLDRPPNTISEMDEMNEKLTRKSASGVIERAGFLHSEPGWWSWIWAYHFGGSMYDPSQNKSLIASRENINAMSWVAENSRRLGVDAVRRFKSGFATEYASRKNALLDEKVAMNVQGPWLANVIGRYRPDLDYGVAPFPVIDGLFRPDEPIGLVDCDVLVIPRGVKHPEASMEFVAYTQRREVVEYLATKHYKGSPLADVSEDFVRNHPNRGVAVHQAIANSPRGFLCPRTRTWPEMKDELDAMFQRVWGHEKPVRSSLEEVDTRVQKVLDLAAQRSARRRSAT